MSDRVSCYRKVSHCHDEAVHDVVHLDFEARTRSRGKTQSDGGHTIAWFFERGEFLRHGDCLVTEDGQHVAVQGAPEPVSKVSTDDPFLLTRVAYHLGNRHVPLQVAPGYLLYQPDYVLDDMVRQLGAVVTTESLPFQPEDGAYHSHEPGGHSHEPGGHSHEPGGHSHEPGGHSHEPGGNSHEPGGNSHGDHIHEH